ncbi:LacI family DNA-binding transcriptional regulator [Agromyces lapidis]|uniref:LacI family DNA-binding transcriptional regulator n=1 Tax=Agromyces lapidis TaxID=279574 RepID=A0ABV5SNX2_9MICO|nr:LacI family DNA-binding transcriptional regulator [Agromyces lapidis]
MQDAREQVPRVTLAQVADRAGVSLKTASRALGGEQYVSHETLTKVLAAANALGYRRNAAASLLASGHLVESIGLIAGDFTNPFYSALAQSVEDDIRQQGMHLSVATSWESAEQERRIVDDLASRQTKALVVVSAMSDHADYAQVQARGVPVVFVDRPAVNLDADSVVFDNRMGGRLAAQHLLDLGHTRIAFVGDYAWLPTYRERLEGMAAVLDGATSSWRELLRDDAHDVASSRARTRELLALPDPPTAIVAGNNRILLGVLEELSATGPDDAPAVIGIDEPEWARVMGITTVAGDVEAVGHHAARLAVSRLGDRTRPVEHVVLPMRLTPRRSTARHGSDSAPLRAE